MKTSVWKNLLLFLSKISKLDINEELRKENEYLKAEIDIYRKQLEQLGRRPKFTDGMRRRLVEKSLALGRRMRDVVTIVRPDTILRWQRRMIAALYDGSKSVKRGRGRPPMNKQIVEAVIKLATENPCWGYDRITGELKKNGVGLSASSVANILDNHGLHPSGTRRHDGMSWGNFIRTHADLWATDFFTAHVWTSCGLVAYYVLFFIHIRTRRIVIAGATPHPNTEWIAQQERNITGFDGALQSATHLIHDRDGKYPKVFDTILQSAGVKPIRLPSHSPNLNAFAERFVHTIKEECLEKLVLVGERSLFKALHEFETHYMTERPHQGVGNVLIEPEKQIARIPLAQDKILELECRQRLGGLLKSYSRKAA